jgi:hypothetical protein
MSSKNWMKVLFNSIYLTFVNLTEIFGLNLQNDTLSSILIYFCKFTLNFWSNFTNGSQMPSIEKIQIYK